MPNTRLWHERSTFRYISIALFVALMGALFSYLFNTRLADHPSVIEQKVPTQDSVNSVASHRGDAETPGASAVGNADRRTSKLASGGDALAEQYDALISRFAAVEASLRTRARDLGDVPLKSDISAAISTSRLDLQAAHEALSMRDYNQANARLTDAQKLVEYLEGL